VEKIAHRDGFCGECFNGGADDPLGRQTLRDPAARRIRPAYHVGEGGRAAAASPPDAQGNYPAVEYARASLARKIIRDRVAAGLSQRDLALRAGVRVETLCRIETGKHVPSVPTIDKLDRALKQAVREKQAGKRPKRGTRKGR